MGLSKKEILEQSRAAFDLWGETWERHSKINGEKYIKDGNRHQDLLHMGAGRTLVCVANGPSLERHIDTLKQYRDKVEIACVDKSFQHLIAHDIIPDFVFLADAGINYDKYLKPWIDKTENVILLANVTSNPDWTLNWKGRVFYYVNKDNIKTEEIYIPLSGCKECIPAASNVGNSLVVASTQLLGYDKYLLIGYDFAWRDNENYYAYESGVDNGKRYWMCHLNLMDNHSVLTNSSQNLYFSARWLMDFYKLMRMNGVQIYNCTGAGLLNVEQRNFEKELKCSIVRELEEKEKNDILQKRIKSIVIRKSDGNEALNDVLQNVAVSDVVVNYIPQEVLEWISP